MIEFDLWYDNKVKEIEKRLPDPNIWEFQIIRFPVNFTELMPLKPNDLIHDTFRIHTISFEKRYINNKYVWKRIVY